MTTDADRHTLLAIARAAIVANFAGAPLWRPTSDGALARTAAVFVSLHGNGNLRGCIGHLDEDQPLAHTVADCARLASTADPRFPAVTPSELLTIAIEISILGPFELIASPDEVEIGRHGLFVEQDHYRGLLLPQVATEWRWDQKAFIEQACHKAGLPRDAWQRGASVCRFEAEVFSER